MSLCNVEGKLERSQSMGALDTIHKCKELQVEKSSGEYCSKERNDSSTPGHEQLLDSLINSYRQILDLKEKNQKLRGVVQQHQSLLKIIKEDSKLCYRDVIIDLMQETIKTMDETEKNFEVIEYSGKPQNQQAKSLLAAIQPKRSRAAADMKTAIPKFENQEKLHDGTAADNSQIKLHMMPLPLAPASVSAQRTPANNEHLDTFEGFNLESFKCKESFRDALKLSKSSDPLSLETEYLYAEELKLSPSPQQPADPGVPVIDHLMQLAVINKKISEGDFNSSFEEALSHCNLALVMGACRAVDPAQLFNPCHLTQAVLLSLVQQLATDMLHETQLKCRYLEEALINLDVTDQVTRMHLPLVVGEVRKHLSKFVSVYPHHVANRRISLIIMAADNLIE